MDPNGPPMMQPAPPGWMGMTPQALGYGMPGYGQGAGTSGMLQAQQVAGSTFGGSMMNAAVGAGTFGLNAFQVGAATVAPLIAAHGSSMGMRALGGAWSAADPFTWGMAGGRMGWAAAEGAGWGMGRRLAMGALGMAGPLALGVAATQVPMSWMEHSLTGVRNAVLGGSTLRAVAPNAFPGQGVSAGQGASFGTEMSHLAKDMGTSTDELAQLTRQLDQMKVFQSTRSISEFRSKFREVLGAIKEIATATKQTVEEATQTFGELKQQGFHTTADITAQAAKRAAQAATSGVSQGELSQYGGMGAQYARSLGMRGKFGADYMSQSVSSMASAYRGMTDAQREVVDEHGGPEQMAAQMAAKNMRFLSSARGRAMIAATLGEGGAPDPERMARMLSGNMTTESIVESAAGRGLGVLGAAGSARVREQYMQYAGPMQLMMAASQARQLHGGYDMRSLTGMMGTMGWSHDETRTMIAQTMQMPKILEEQANAQTYAMQQAEYARNRKESSWWGKLSGGWDHYTGGWEKDAARMAGGLSTSFTNVANSLVGYDETTIGERGYARAREVTRRGGVSRDLDRAYRSGTFLGPDSGHDRVLDRHGAWSQTATRGKGGYATATGGWVSDADAIELSDPGMFGSEMQIITREDLARAQKESQETVKLDAENAASVRLALKGTYADSSMAGRALGAALSLGGNFGTARSGNWKETMSGSLDYEAGLYQNYVGAGKLTSGELRTWLLGRSSGSNGGYTTIESYLRDKQSKDPDAKSRFTRYNRAMRAEVDSVLPASEAKRFGTTGSASVSSADEAKDQLREAVFATIDGRLAGASGHGAGLLLAMAMGPGGADYDFAQAVASNTETADAFASLMKSTTSTQREIAVDRLKDAFGENSQEFRKVQDLISDPEKFKEAQARFVAGDVDRLTSDSAAATSLKIRADKERSALKKYRQGVAADPRKKWDDATVAAMEALVAAGETGDRRGAKRDLFSALAASGGDIDENEKDFLTAFTGDTSAQTLASQLGWLAGEDKDARAKAAKLLGIDESKLAAAMEGLGGKENYSKRLQKGIELAHKSGAIDDMYSEGASATTVAGTSEAYVEANTRFVTAVKNFVDVLGTKFPQVEAAGKDVQGTAAEIPGPSTSIR